MSLLARFKAWQLGCAVGIATCAIVGIRAGQAHFQQAAGADPKDDDRSGFTNILEHDPIICGGSNRTTTFRVRVTNRTPLVVRFQNFASSCTCTSARLEQTELPSGESTSVTMTVDLAGREGDQSFRSSWRDDSGREWSAEVRVSIYKPQRFLPNSVSRGSVEAGARLSQDVVFEEYARSAAEFVQPPRLIGQAESRAAVEVVVGESAVERVSDTCHRRRTPVVIRWTVPELAGYNDLFVLSTPGPGAAACSCRVGWRVDEAVEASPVRVAFAAVKGSGDEVLRRTVTLRSKTAASLHLDSLETSEACIAAKVVPAAIADPREVTLEITVAVGANRDVLSGTVTARIKTESVQQVRIPVTVLRGDP